MSRFTKDERFRVAGAIRDWIHDQPWSECNIGADTCPDWPKAFEIRDVALGALEPAPESAPAPESPPAPEPGSTPRLESATARFVRVMEEWGGHLQRTSKTLADVIREVEKGRGGR